MKTVFLGIVFTIASASITLAELQPEPDVGDGNVAKSAQETVVEKKVEGFGQLACPSPDGRYAITWPKPEEGGISNQLVDLKAGKAVHTIADGEIAIFESMNHGGLSALWRADSKAVVVNLQGKWGPRAIWLLVIGEDGKVMADELTGPVRIGLAKVIEKNAGFGERDPESFAANLSYEFRADGKSLDIKAEGEVNPKQIADQAHIVANITGTFDLAARKLTLTDGEVTESRIMPFE